jgi:hypothetical protein
MGEDLGNRSYSHQLGGMFDANTADFCAAGIAVLGWLPGSIKTPMLPLVLAKAAAVFLPRGPSMQDAPRSVFLFVGVPILRA